MAAPEYKIRIKNATTDNDKKVAGSISFSKVGPKNTASGSVSGFPDGGTLSAKGAPSFSASYDVLAEEIVSNLQSQLVDKYNVGVTLEKYIEEPTPPPPPPVEEKKEEVPQEEKKEETTEEVKKETPPVVVMTPPETVTTPSKPAIEKKELVHRIITVFDKNIELDELSLPASDANTKQKPEDVISIEYPLIKINEYIFSRDEILSFNIDCTEFLPKIAINVALINQLFLAKEMPRDGDIISIAIRSNQLLKMIRNDYVITGVHVMPNMTEVKSPVLITFYGELFIPGLKSQVGDLSFEGTSFMALQDYARSVGLGFASNEQDTDDKQIWLKANMAGDLYANDVCHKAWKDQDSFFDCWIDVYYCLNFVNINKQLISGESEVDMAALVSNVDKNYIYGANTSEEDIVPTVKVFSNFPNFRTSPFFIKTWHPMNRSTHITFEIGTKMTCEMFEHNHNLYNNPDSQKYWMVGVEPTYDKNKTSKYQLLRGRAAYVKDDKNPELKRANHSFIGLYEKMPWLGVQYTISNPNDSNMQWDGNHHRNYHVARVKNLINNKELNKLNVHIEVDGNNLNIIRGDKVPIVLVKTDRLENLMVNQNSNFNDVMDLFYSGWYLVKGFIITWDSKNEGSIISNFKEEFILTRREWPTPIPIEPIKTNV